MQLYLKFLTWILPGLSWSRFMPFRTGMPDQNGSGPDQKTYRYPLSAYNFDPILWHIRHAHQKDQMDNFDYENQIDQNYLKKRGARTYPKFGYEYYHAGVNPNVWRKLQEIDGYYQKIRKLGHVPTRWEEDQG